MMLQKYIDYTNIGKIIIIKKYNIDTDLSCDNLIQQNNLVCRCLIYIL